MTFSVKAGLGINDGKVSSMNVNVPEKKRDYRIDIEAAAVSIAETQKNGGEIPWCEGDKTDPWDHVEAAMGLAVAGHLDKARSAYEWSARTQLDDGCWYAEYREGEPSNLRRDANFTSYIAVGVYHYYLITGDESFLCRMWETVRSAIDFTLRLQGTGGEIRWAILADGKIDPMALLTGSSSVHMSVKCALAIADKLGLEKPEWKIALGRLGNAIRNKPHCFNMTKSRYSMDWYYPVLSGALTGQAAQKRIERYWKKFVVRGQGVRCVSDEPWVTIAETCELCLSLCAMGNAPLAEIVFNWILDKTYEDGSYWCGFTFPNMVIWPEEKTTWTNGAVLMAADALYNLTPAGGMFGHRLWRDSGIV